MLAQHYECYFMSVGTTSAQRILALSPRDAAETYASVAWLAPQHDGDSTRVIVVGKDKRGRALRKEFMVTIRMVATFRAEAQKRSDR
jgi:hypothetical protein